MAGQRVGYRRVSTADQSTARQLDGVAVDRVFTDHVSGATRDRPALQDLRRYVTTGRQPIPPRRRLPQFRGPSSTTGSSGGSHVL